MESNTEIIAKSTLAVTAADSTVLGISVRAWIAVVLVLTVSGSHLATVAAVLTEAVVTHNYDKVGTFANIGEPLYSMSVAALGFYFGQKTNKP